MTLKDRVEGLKRTLIALGRPDLGQLAETLEDEIEYEGLEPVASEVLFVLDFSGSIRQQLRQGKLQRAAEYAALMGLEFDNNEQIPVIGYATICRELPAINVHTIDGYVDKALTLSAPEEDVSQLNELKRLMKKARQTSGKLSGGLMQGIGNDNVEPLVITRIIQMVENSSKNKPWFICFFTDGGIDPGLYEEIIDLLVQAKKLPIFWKFIGLGGDEEGYGVLAAFDDYVKTRGLSIDSCDFQLVDDILLINPAEMYRRMLVEYSAYIKRARELEILV